MIVGVLLGALVSIAVGVALAVWVSDGFGVKVSEVALVIVSLGTGVSVDIEAAGVLSRPQPTKNTNDRQKTRI